MTSDTTCMLNGHTSQSVFGIFPLFAFLAGIPSGPYGAAQSSMNASSAMSIPCHTGHSSIEFSFDPPRSPGTPRPWVQSCRSASKSYSFRRSGRLVELAGQSMNPPSRTRFGLPSSPPTCLPTPWSIVISAYPPRKATRQCRKPLPPLTHRSILFVPCCFSFAPFLYVFFGFCFFFSRYFVSLASMPSCACQLWKALPHMHHPKSQGGSKSPSSTPSLQKLRFSSLHYSMAGLLLEISLSHGEAASLFHLTLTPSSISIGAQYAGCPPLRPIPPCDICHMVQDVHLHVSSSFILLHCPSRDCHSEIRYRQSRCECRLGCTLTFSGFDHRGICRLPQRSAFGLSAPRLPLSPRTQRAVCSCRLGHDSQLLHEEDSERLQHVS